MGPGAHRRPSAPRPAATLGVKGEAPRTRARARSFPHRQPPQHPQLRASGGTTTSSAPRDPSSNSERGGAGRGRRESKRCATGGDRGRATGGDHSGGTPRDHKHTRFPRIAREDNFLTEGGTIPTTASPRQPRAACNEKTHAPGCARGRGVCGTIKVPSRVILSIRGQGEPATGHPPKARPLKAPKKRSSEHSLTNKKRPAATAQHHHTRRAYGKAASGGRSPNEEGSLLLPLGGQDFSNTALSFSSTPLLPGSHGQDGKRNTQPDGAREAQRETGEPPPTQKRAPRYSKARTAPGAPRGLAKAGRVQTPDGNGYAPQQGSHPSPARGRGHDERDTDDVRTTESLTRPRGPRELQREVRAGQCSGRTAAPLPSTRHRHRWGGETRGPLAEREERPPFAVNGHSP